MISINQALWRPLVYTLGGSKYMVIQGEPGVFIRGKKVRSLVFGFHFLLHWHILLRCTIQLIFMTFFSQANDPPLDFIKETTLLQVSVDITNSLLVCNANKFIKKQQRTMEHKLYSLYAYGLGN